MKLTLISGSTRPGSQSLKVARYLDQRINTLFPEDEPYIVDLQSIRIPLQPDDSSPEWDYIKGEHIELADGYVIISPEWHGMAAPGIKNFFVHVGKTALAHKPVLLVAVSSGRGGAYPIAELRMSSSKNTRAVYLPDHLIIRDVDNVLNDTVNTNHPSDQWYRDYADYCLRLTREYAMALAAMRRHGSVDLERYPNGM
jgi:NAD(P)H-dependent FMN reductase